MRGGEKKKEKRYFFCSSGGIEIGGGFNIDRISYSVLFFFAPLVR